MKRWTFGALAAACCLLYLLSLTSVHTYDALSYILDVDRKPWRELFHPHHLAYGPLGALIRGTAVGLGWQGSAERLLQGANALAGAVGVTLLGALATRLTGRLWAGALAGLLLASSYAYWYYAVEVEVYTIAAALLIGALWLMLELARRPGLALAAALGAVQGCAVLFHQTNVLLCAPALATLLAATGGGNRLRRLAPLAVAYGAPLALIVGGAYLGVGLGVSGFRSWGELTAWAAGYTTTGYWGGAVDGAKLALLGQGLAESLAQPGGALVGLTLLTTLLVSLRGLAAAPTGLVPVVLSWLAVYGAFFLWWEPDNIEFWIASLPPFYLLAVLAAAGLPRPRARAAASLGLLACGAAMLGLNWASISRRGDADQDLQRALTRDLVAQSQPGDLLVVPDGLVELYLPFYGGRENVAALGQAMTAAGGDWPAACGLLRGRVEAAMRGGYGVLLAAEALRPAPAPPGEPPTPAERLGLGAETVAACYEPFISALEPLPLAAELPAYYRLPSAQALAQGPGWDFRRGSWGWRVINAEASATDGDGWALRPGADPALVSPVMAIEAGRFAALEVRLAADTAARDAQLFFLDAGGQTDEARSLRWELAPGPEPHTYRLELRGAPGWEGTVTGLRLDPVSAGDGGTVRLEWLRLLP